MLFAFAVQFCLFVCLPPCSLPINIAFFRSMSLWFDYLFRQYFFSFFFAFFDIFFIFSMFFFELKVEQNVKCFRHLNMFYYFFLLLLLLLYFLFFSFSILNTLADNRMVLVWGWEYRQARQTKTLINILSLLLNSFPFFAILCRCLCKDYQLAIVASVFDIESNKAPTIQLINIFTDQKCWVSECVGMRINVRNCEC